MFRRSNGIHRDPYIRKSATLRVCFPVSARIRSFSAHASEKVRVIRIWNVEAGIYISRKGRREGGPAMRGSKRFLKPGQENSYRVSERATMTRGKHSDIYRPTRGVRCCAKDTVDTDDIWTRIDGRRREEWTATAENGRICIRWQRFPRRDSYYDGNCEPFSTVVNSIQVGDVNVTRDSQNAYVLRM